MIVPPPTPKRPLKAPGAARIAPSRRSSARRIGAPPSGVTASVHRWPGGDTSRMPRTDTKPAGLEILQPLRADPGHSAVFSDVDGTLAPISERPEQTAVPDAARAA